MEPYPRAFADVVTASIDGILDRQREDGAIACDPDAPIVYPQQALFPLAFCWAGLDPERRWQGSPRIREAIIRLARFVMSRFDAAGRFAYDSFGNPVNVVDQRLTAAWTECLRVLREAQGDFPFDEWRGPIERACTTLIAHRLEKLPGLRRFVRPVIGTGTNHVVLYLTTVYRAGMVLGREDFVELALPIARALAADVHPDGYWEEHGDLDRRGGPTPAYNYLSMGGIGLLHAWTGEPVFASAIDRATRFHSSFSYPDGRPCELIDERVRAGHSAAPMIWGLHAMSRTPEGRGAAVRHFEGWLRLASAKVRTSPELMARMCENFLYWESGTIGTAPTDRRDHTASMTLPASVHRHGAWFAGLSCIRAINAEDPSFRDNPVALERQKLFSLWHERVGLVIDGSPSKGQPQNSTFSAATVDAPDYLPCGGATGVDETELVARASYRTFIGEARLSFPSDGEARITLAVDPVGNRGPFDAAFTLAHRGTGILTATGRHVDLTGRISLTFSEMGGAFHYGSCRISGPGDARLEWPYEPFDPYTADHKPFPGHEQLRIAVTLDRERNRCQFVVAIA
jgi:hypothetical protein